jgi:hypothetical protein
MCIFNILKIFKNSIDFSPKLITPISLLEETLVRSNRAEKCSGQRMRPLARQVEMGNG